MEEINDASGRPAAQAQAVPQADNPQALVRPEAKTIEELLAQFSGQEGALRNLTFLSESEQSLLRQHMAKQEVDRLKRLGELQGLMDDAQTEIDKGNHIRTFAASNDPEVIRKQREIDLLARQAQAALLIEPPKSIIDVIDFDPSLPQEMIINVYPGFPSVISFYDSTGAIWPVISAALGATGLFTAEKIGGAPGMYKVEALQPGAHLSGMFFLEGLDTAIPFRVNSVNTKMVNTRRQVMIPLTGPNAKKADIIKSDLTTPDKLGDEMFAFISGTISGIDGAVEHKLTGVPGQAFEYNGAVYIRTTAHLRAPILAETALGQWRLFKTYKRSFYWFAHNRREVKGYVKYGEE